MGAAYPGGSLVLLLILVLLALAVSLLRVQHCPLHAQRLKLVPDILPIHLGLLVLSLLEERGNCVARVQSALLLQLSRGRVLGLRGPQAVELVHGAAIGGGDDLAASSVPLPHHAAALHQDHARGRRWGLLLRGGAERGAEGANNQRDDEGQHSDGAVARENEHGRSGWRKGRVKGAAK